MAYGSELVLGWLGKQQIELIIHPLGLTIDWGARDLKPESDVKKICDALGKIYPNALKALPALSGCRFGKVSGSYMEDYVGVETPAGVRAMSPWHAHRYCVSANHGRHDHLQGNPLLILLGE